VGVAHLGHIGVVHLRAFINGCGSALVGVAHLLVCGSSLGTGIGAYISGCGSSLVGVVRLWAQ
jgi:hypothetical protein